MYEEKPRAIFCRYAVPDMADVVFGTLCVLVNAVFISLRLDLPSMAAAAMSLPLLEGIVILSIAVATGVGAQVGRCLTRGKRREAARVFSRALAVTMMASILIIVLGNVLFLRLAMPRSTTPEACVMAVEYTRYIVSFAPFFIFSALLGIRARIIGRVRLTVAARIAGLVAHIALDLIFLYRLDLGIAGAALGMAFGQVCTAIILLAGCFPRKTSLAPEKTYPRLIYIGRAPKEGFVAFAIGAFAILVSYLGSRFFIRTGYGEPGLAASLVLNSLAFVVSMAFLGAANGLRPVFGYLAAVGSRKRPLALLRFSAAACSGIGALCFLFFIMGAGCLFHTFILDDPAFLKFLCEKGLPYCCGLVIAGYNILSLSYWASTHSAKKALVILTLRTLLCPAVLTAMLPLMPGREAIWLFAPVSEALTFIGVMAAFKGIGKEERRLKFRKQLTDKP